MSCALTHLAFIADGNRRWAASKGYAIGYDAGYKAAYSAIEAAFNAGVQVVSIFIFSKENWKRPLEQREYIFSLVLKAAGREIAKLTQMNARLLIIGDRSTLPERIRKSVEAAEHATRHHQRTLIVALNYSGKDDIVRASRKLTQRIQAGELSINDITEQTFAEQLDTHGIPDPDVIIRTTEQRLSNFMLWQAAYSEIRFIPKNWPDITPDDIRNIISDYHSANRSFGG